MDPLYSFFSLLFSFFVSSLCFIWLNIVSTTFVLYLLFFTIIFIHSFFFCFPHLLYNCLFSSHRTRFVVRICLLQLRDRLCYLFSLYFAIKHLGTDFPVPVSYTHLSSMSPIMAEIYMNYFENKIMSTVKNKDKIKKYIIYIYIYIYIYIFVWWLVWIYN